MSERLREWAPDAVIGLAVLVLGLLEVWAATLPFGDPNSAAPPVDHPRWEYVLLIVAFAAASGLSRRAPLAALLLVWLTCAGQLVAGTSVLSVELAVTLVAFGCGRWGGPFTVLLSGLSIPAAAGVGYVIVTRTSMGVFRELSFSRDLAENASRFGDTLAVGATILGFLVLAVPWLAGLVLRFLARARRSEVRSEAAEADAAQAQRETAQVLEIARLREQQATLAQDVHDVVGHSLAVILAQAESGQYLPDHDPAALKQTLATIATSARSSLQDVRNVLSASPEPALAPNRAYDVLLGGVRDAGHEVSATEVGVARPLPPELELVAHRVLQEMLTNAMKHGRRDRPVHVQRHWPGGRPEPAAADRDLRIEVRNVEAHGKDETQPLSPAIRASGQGLEGMRRRLEAVGGRLEVRRCVEDGEPTFTATAWVPVSGRRATGE